MEIVISAAVGIPTLVLAFLVYRLNTKQILKRLHYTSHCRSFVWGPQDENIEVYAQGRPLISPNLYLFRLENTGKAPITPTDFAAPLKLHFGKPAQIICRHVICNRSGLLEEGSVRGDGGDIFVEPFLLNPRDRIDFIVVVDGVPAEPLVQARIAGVEEVVFLPPLNQGTILHNIYRSLLFRTMAECPHPGGRLDPGIIVTPNLVDPTKIMHGSLDVLVRGKSVPNPHTFSVCINSGDHGPVEEKDIEKPLILEWPETLVGDVNGRLDDAELDALALSRFVTWDNHQVAICPAPLGLDQTLVINVITSGSGDDLRATQLPRLMSNIMIGRFILDNLVEDNLLKMEPRILLSRYFAYTLWQRWKPKVQRRLRLAIENTKKITKSSRWR